jgi:hypothetical protein
MKSASEALQTKIIMAKREWETCPLLNGDERQLVVVLRTAAESGLEEFQKTKRLVVDGRYDTLSRAIHKARSLGMLRHWPS